MLDITQETWKGFPKCNWYPSLVSVYLWF